MKEISIKWHGPFNLNKLKDFDPENNFNFYFFYYKTLEIKRKPERTIRPIYWYIGSSSDAVKRTKYHKIKEEFRKKYSETFMDIEIFLEEHPWFENLIKSIFSGFYRRLDKLNGFIGDWLLDQKINVYFGQGLINNKIISADEKLIRGIENGLICYHDKNKIKLLKNDYTLNDHYTNCYKRKYEELLIFNQGNKFMKRIIYTNDLPKC